MTGTKTAAGHGKRYCGGKKRQGEGTCTRPPGWGTTHSGTGYCKLHGGSTPNQVKAAERRQAEDGARRILADFGTAAPVSNPLEALAQLAGEIVAVKDAFRAMVERLNSVRYSTDGGEQLRAEVALYERALDRSARILGDIARLGLDERLVKISERQASVVVGALNAALTAAGVAVGTEQRQLANAVLSRELRAGTASPTAGSTR